MQASLALSNQTNSPLDEAWVSLDLETTGLSAERDKIIEIGATKFHGEQVLDTFQSFVNPGRRLDSFIRRYTGITQADVDGAPDFSAVSGAFASFIGRSPVVGHNVGFDLGFLERAGLRLPNPVCDTWDMAFVVSPGQSSYSLTGLAAWLKVDHPSPHRAYEDARATKEVFVRLVERFSKLDLYILAEMERQAARSSWVLHYLLSRLTAYKVGTAASADQSAAGGVAAPTAGIGLEGIDTQELAERLRHGRPLRPNRDVNEIDVELVDSLLRSRSPLSERFPGFEERPQQIAMARKVTEAMNRGEGLIVEAGTGVGKSLAYLLPALLYATANNSRVVVSTNTINLQEQLLNKDIPALLEALEHVPGVSVEETGFTQLKGRANYLCLRRWNHLRSSETVSAGEARLLAKTLVWLQTTAVGDRSELNLGHAAAAAPWDRVSAQGAPDCPGHGGPCFLRAAREKAAASHLVVVNHALLLSDVVAEGSLIPAHDILIVDEAHHLEEEATRHLGFELAQSRFDDHLQSLTGDRGVLNEAVNAFRGSSVAATREESVRRLAEDATSPMPRIRDALARLFAALGALLSPERQGSLQPGGEVRVTAATRAQPGWSDLEIQWENADLLLSDLGTALGNVRLSLEGLEEAGVLNYEGLMAELTNVAQTNVELRERLREFVPNPRSDGIYWATRTLRAGEIVLRAAPLSVGETLREQLFSNKRCTVLTSATLSTDEGFDHIRERTGFSDGDDLLLGSPFDYPKAAMLCLPEDMPQPSSWAYQAAVEEAVKEATLAAGGRTMALFTSHAALRSTASAVRGGLEAEGIKVLAQGVDGTPRQLVRRFLEEPSSLILGTASFWEGVDLAGESLQVLLVARLPFSVPTEPVFAARSELYDDSFNQYAVPQAVLRLRQGFGRLIRTSSDRGVAIILDSRITSRRYGRTFLNSLPPATVTRCSVHDVRAQVQAWIRG